MGQRLWELGGRKIRRGRKQCKLQLCLVGVNCSKYSAQKRLGSANPLHELPSLPRRGRPPSLPAHGDGAKLAKELLPEMFGNWFTGCSSPGQGGQSDTESSQTLNQAAGFSSSPFSSYQDKQRLCVHTISLSLSSSSSLSVLSIPPHLQMPAKPLLPRLRASPAARQPSQTQLPARSEKPARLSAF